MTHQAKKPDKREQRFQEMLKKREESRSLPPIDATEPIGTYSELEDGAVPIIDPRPEYSYIPLKKILVKKQVRSREAIEAGDIDALTEAIRSRGVDTPIIVKPIREGDTIRYELIAGERRLEASKRAGKLHIPARITNDNISELEKLTIQLEENLLREDLNPVEEALGYLEYYRLAMEDDTITPQRMINDIITYGTSSQKLQTSKLDVLDGLRKLSGKSITYLKRLESVLTLPENAIEAVRNGKLNKSQAQVFVENIGHEKFNEVLDLALSEEMTANGIREAFGKSAKNAKEEDPAKEPTGQEKRKRGGQVAFFGKRMVMIKKDVDKYQEQMSVEHVQKLVEETKDFLLQLTEILTAKMKS